MNIEGEDNILNVNHQLNIKLIFINLGYRKKNKNYKEFLIILLLTHRLAVY